MKFLAALLLLPLLLPRPACAQTKALIDRQTHRFYLSANIRLDHRIFGYAAADTTARKLILFSIFTSDVKGNPHHCPLGAYYDTSGLPREADISWTGEKPGFVRLVFRNGQQPATPFYIRRQFVTFR